MTYIYRREEESLWEREDYVCIITVHSKHDSNVHLCHSGEVGDEFHSLLVVFYFIMREWNTLIHAAKDSQMSQELNRSFLKQTETTELIWWTIWIFLYTCSLFVFLCLLYTNRGLKKKKSIIVMLVSAIRAMTGGGTLNDPWITYYMQILIFCRFYLKSAINTLLFLKWFFTILSFCSEFLFQVDLTLPWRAHVQEILG